MERVRLKIIRFVDDGQPGIVEAELLDAEGSLHRFIDKAPIFTSEKLSRLSAYPRPGDARCRVLERFYGADARRLARITLRRPDDLKSTEGISIFVVRESQLAGD